MPAPDPWTSILNFLQTMIVPNWGELISMLPFFLLIGVIGPILSLVMFMWLWHALHRRRGRVRIAEEEAMPALRDGSGNPLFPPNVPFCDDHALLFPANRTTCEVDGDELSVVCPVDRTARPAAQQVCLVCGTRYVLGAARTALTVRRTGRPPSGGAAIA
ncbi:MAG: hypothetical protein QOH61_1965 [Chloroflexota bacterium]|nr:hypothetical protein [Chloroflexota bacterium]